MRNWTFLIALPSLLVLSSSASTLQATPEFKSWLGSAYALPGEESELWLTITSDSRPAMRPVVPETEHLTFKFIDDPILPDSTTERTYTYRYAVVSYREGSHVIPPFSLAHKGTTLRSQPLRFNVASLPDRAWFDYKVHNETCKFASIISLPSGSPFEGESIPAEVKVYFPARFKVDKASIAELSQEGLTAKRFNASGAIPWKREVVTPVRLKQENYRGLTYRSTITPLQGGSASIGPGWARLTLLARVSHQGGTKEIRVPLELPVPMLSFSARPLPRPSPEGFQNAVGRFTLSAKANTDGLTDDDPIAVHLSVTGTGNLDTLKAPAFTGTIDAWKSYPPHRLPRQGESSDNSGVTSFSHTIRPKNRQNSIPSYRLISFDPDTEQYITSSTPPIPFTADYPKPAFSRPAIKSPDLNTPIEEMESILGVITPGEAPDSRFHFWRLWHLLPALLALALVIRIVVTRIIPHFAPSRRQLELREDLASLADNKGDSREFLRATGSFIEQWIPEESRDEEIRQLLTRRDQHCYSLQSNSPEIQGPERQTAVGHLRRRILEITSILSFFALLATGEIQASSETPFETKLCHQAQDAWLEKDYLLALSLYHKAYENNPLSADILYNIGNCYFKINEHGMAALYYRRALHQNREHPEALQNLQFLNRETGAITTEHPKHKKWLSIASPTLYLNIMTGGLWVSLLSILSFLSLQRWPRLRMTSLYLGSAFALLGGAGLLLYPSDNQFAPPHEQAIMINKVPIAASTEATTITDGDNNPQIDSKKVITVPPGNLCRLIAKRGKWAYIELPNHVRGWVPSKFAHPVIPMDRVLHSLKQEGT